MTFCSTRSKVQSNLKYNTLRYYSLLIIELLTAPMWCSKQGTTCIAARAGQVEIKELQVFTIKGGTEYILSYGSTKEVFSKDLSVAQKMIDSFQITR